MCMVPLDGLVSWLNHIKWKKLAEVTPDAEELVNEHLRRMKAVLDYLTRKTGKTPSEAHSASLTEGDDPERAKTVMNKLAKEVDFTKAGIRESLLLIICACYCWETDRGLSRFANPWEPILGLIGMGYPIGFDEPPDGMHVEIVVLCKHRDEKYTVI